MVRAIKWAGIGLGALLVLALLLLLIAPYVVNLERYRSLLTTRASRALGRDVTLGALRVSLWSGLGVDVQGIRVAGAPGSGSEPLLTADALRIRLRLLPLLRGQVKVSTATLQKPSIRLTRGPDGQWSIADVFKPPPHPGAPRTAPEAARPARPPLLGGVLLSEVDVKNGQVTLLDQAGKKPLTVTLTDVDLGLRQANLSDPIRVRGRASVGDDAGRLEVTGRVLPESETFTLDLALTVKDLASSLIQALLLGPDSTAQLAGRISGDAKISGTPATAGVTGQLDLTPLEVRLGGFTKPAGEGGRLAFTGRREPPGLRVSRLEFEWKDVSLTGTLQVPDLKNPRLVFDASAPRLDLDRLLAAKPKKAWLAPREAAAAPPPAAPPSRGMPVQGRLRISDLRYGGLAWSAVDGAVRYQAGVLTISSAGAGFFQGRMTVSGEADFAAKQTRVALKSRLTDVATQRVVKALVAGPWSLHGRLTGTTDLSFTGLSGQAILGSARGAGILDLKDGRLVDYKPLERLAEVIGPVLAAQGVRTRLNEFQQLSGSFTVDKGVVRTRDLTLTKAEGTVTAVGSLGLLDSAVDFDVTVRLGRTTVEAKVTGTTSQPTVVPKLGRLQQKLEREIDKIVPGEQGKSLKDLFRGFFGK